MWIIDWLRPKWDQRRLPRLRSYCLLNYTKFSRTEGEGTKEVSNIRDISETGLQFTAYEPLKKDMLLDVKINLPDLEEPVSSRARVMWSKKLKQESDAYRVGIRFLELSDKQREAIGRHIQQAASDRLGKKLIQGRSIQQHRRKQ